LMMCSTVAYWDSRYADRSAAVQHAGDGVSMRVGQFGQAVHAGSHCDAQAVGVVSQALGNHLPDSFSAKKGDRCQRQVLREYTTTGD
jgi:hypothetical protein